MTNGGHTTLFLCGDVMTGRGIDQALPHPADPQLHEINVKNAADYVGFAERASGRISRLGFDYIWGNALDIWEREEPSRKIINLETAITRSNARWAGKSVHYKMSPANVASLNAAKIDCCVLANNHTLDWGVDGLLETLDTLDQAKIHHAGAGRNLREAQMPAVLAIGEKIRVIVFGLGSTSSGIPAEWAAEENRPGLFLLECMKEDPIKTLADNMSAIRRAGNLVIASIHWGSNWGYNVSSSDRRLAHRLIDEVGVDILHGHSSHHVQGIEVYKGRLILYGCGDFLNDYEGIGGYETFRGDLALMYFADLDSDSGKLLALRMVPLQIRRFRLNRVNPSDSQWLAHLLCREGMRFHTTVQRTAENTFELSWHSTS